MKRRYGWLLVLVVAALLAAACGPTMATPTPNSAEGGTSTASPQPSAIAQVTPQIEATAAAPAVDPADLPVDATDYHVLGSADAPVTFIEYSDFQ
jgi:protein-disulfide isomerase